MPSTFALETFARRSVNYLERLVDRDGLPYFNVFATDPAEAAHDWPDFGDVMSRQLQAAIMLRRMTGQEAATEKTWLRKIRSLINPDDGLLYRPETNYSRRVADTGDQALTLYALATAYLDTGDPDIRRMVHRMVEGLRARHKPADLGNGFILKSLMTCARHVECPAALDLAASIARRYFSQDPTFTPDNTFGPRGHMHINLRTLVGLADFALYVGDPVLYSRTDALYRWVRSIGTRFGFLPEVYGRKGDVVACETCALMDFAGLGITLANHGHPEYWGDMERLARNQLVESQLTDGSWLRGDPAREDTNQSTWRDIGSRAVGAWTCWSSPNHILACRETLNAHWGGPELRDKPRALANCCGGSGMHALFTLWKNAARVENGYLTVHMHIDKKLPQAEIRCFQPFQGLLRIRMEQPCALKVRIPDFVTPADVRVTVDGRDLTAIVCGNYLNIGPRAVGECVEVKYPLDAAAEEVTVGNPGHRQYRYHVTWKGDTVTGMEPMGNEIPTGYSDFDKRQVPVYYGKEGPGPLYIGRDVPSDVVPDLSPVHADDGALDLWHFPGSTDFDPSGRE